MTGSNGVGYSPQGLKPGFICAPRAALKRRSSTEALARTVSHASFCTQDLARRFFTPSSFPKFFRANSISVIASPLQCNTAFGTLVFHALYLRH